MNNPLQSAIIIHMDGLPLLDVNLDPEQERGMDGLVNLFGGFSSAINALMRELGHKEIKSITVADGVLVYSSHEPLLFVVHASDEKYEKLAEIFIKEIQREFLVSYEDEIHDENILSNMESFEPFAERVTDIYESLTIIDGKYPDLIEYIPSDIPLIELYELLHVGLDIIEGYPDDTIKIVRRLDQYFKGKEQTIDDLAFAIGKYSGRVIAQERFKKEYIITPKHVLKLLEEISVVKLDSENDLYDMKLCPICRGKRADRPICGFFSGFIEGALSNPAISVREVACKAMGEPSCKYKLERK